MYQIKYYYQTGNSFGRHDEEELFELTWKSEEAAQKALLDIREHYEFYKAVNRDQGPWRKEDGDDKTVKEAPKKSWYVHDPDSGLSHYCLILKTDEGKDYKFHAPWCGYFETLYGAEIVNTNSKNKFKVGR